MTILSRRTLLQSLLAATALSASHRPGWPQQSGVPQPNPFRYEDVVRRARELSAAPFEAAAAQLPEPLNRLSFDDYRDIRFRPDRALLASGNGPFRMHLFHLGFLYQRPVTVNVIRDGVPTPVPYQRELFDYGRNKIERPLPVNLGFAGFRLHYPLNDPKVFDELIAFLGASYFRFLGAGQKYGLSARGLAINVESGEAEEFPHFREFWVEMPKPNEERAVVYALLDSPSVAGAYRFDIYPSKETTLDVTATLFPRQALTNVGLAPLTSMYFEGENARKTTDDYRPEIHDSDGLLMQSGAGEWIWRPLRNPGRKAISSFSDNNPRGFGLMQRDREFEHYQDLEAHYHQRPGYWVEPIGQWGEGWVELVEIPTPDETHDNIVAYWQPNRAYEPGQEVVISYRLRAAAAIGAMHPGGKAVNTFQTPPRASGSNAPSDPRHRRFIVDFAGGNLPYYLGAPEQVQLVPSTSTGQITNSFLMPNPHIGGFRAALDVRLEAGQSTDLRAFLRAGNRALTETWTYPWAVE
ncbi:OpgD/OpgG family glucan biosynthesis protein [Microvirga arsenatis]|uniref:Glucan biosynthesis protein G n=1 Tax=Microvirga arsenatis TaxID=2692265 RepID=A0ABW9YZQ6_9HYPH|nr:glucan biosynthesis protein G [Microvirga arsenatis]NBJ12224.1 glucan biosynthesis protein G [Microvirga arsenatis]NBJ25876.1 glucan biosynthesis protein G [Microvirga arsenatis]